MTDNTRRGIVTREAVGPRGELGAFAAGHRADVNDRIRRSLAAGHGPLSLVIIAIEDFGAINDWLGFRAGDEVLRIVGERLVAAMREGDVVANLGGDEFAVLLPAPGELAAPAANRLLLAIEQPMVVDGHSLRLRTVAGLAVAASVEAGRDLIQRAGIALHAGRTAASGGVTVFDATALDARRHRQQLHDELCDAVEDNQFFLVYQPITRVSSRALKGFEALVRWHHPVRGDIGPNEFIPLAEETGVVIPLSRWILVEACTQLHRWHRAEPTSAATTMNINVSAQHLHTPEFIADVVHALSTSGVDPSTVILEITESAVMVDVDTSVRQLTTLRSLGLRIALDDFGTGHSSLGYLRSIPADILKIDRSFVIQLATCSITNAIVHAIQDLSSCLHIETVAEGAETADQVEALATLGVTHIQGYYFAKPQSPATVDEQLRHWVAPDGMSPRRAAAAATLAVLEGGHVA